MQRLIRERDEKLIVSSLLIHANRVTLQLTLYYLPAMELLDHLAELESYRALLTRLTPDGSTSWTALGMAEDAARWALRAIPATALTDEQLRARREQLRTQLRAKLPMHSAWEQRTAQLRDVLELLQQVTAQQQRMAA